MAKVAELLNRLLSPDFIAPLAIAAALLLLSGIFNILYTMLHDPDQFLAAMSRIGPVPSQSLQNLTELILVFTGYAMIVLGSYTLYNAAKGYRRAVKYVLPVAITLILVGALLVVALSYAKGGGY